MPIPEPEATAQWVVVDDLPGDGAVYPVEREGALLWLVRRGSTLESVCDEMNVYANHLTSQSQWVQRWEGRTPSHLKVC